jgi:MinD-like ATPase involved in chromosome partitioning or flagellar assembly/CheY-like chemotaxis protein
MSRRVLLAVSGPDEVRIVHGLAQLGQDDLHVVRRCADLAEVLAAAAGGLADLALLDLDLRGLDAAAVADLESHGVTVVGYVADPDRSRRTALPGADRIVTGGDSVADVAAALRGARAGAAVDPAAGSHEEPEETGRRSPGPTRGTEPAVVRAGEGSRLPSGRDAGTSPTGVEGETPVTEDDAAGGVVPGITVLWSPVGSPGRSTLAVALAAQMARRGQEQILVDADTWGASLAQILGVLDESSGLVAACRRAGNGELAARRIEDLLPVVLPGVRLLSGATAASRWPEISEPDLESVLSACRATGRHVIVDVAAPLEQDEDAAFDTFAPRRNGATLTTLAAADRVLAVVGADPVGLARLLRAWDELQAATSAPVRIVLSKVRGSAEEREVRRLLDSSLPGVAVHSVPADDAGAARALWEGASIGEAVPRSPLVAATGRLADALGVPDPAGRRRR